MGQSELLPDEAIMNLRKYTVLYIDDNSVNLQIVKSLLEKQKNVTAIIVDTAAGGMELLKKNYFDAIFMDIRMPVMDGYQCTIAIRNGEVGTLNQRIPVIAFTSDGSAETKAKAFAAGMGRFLIKNFCKDVLYQELKDACNLTINPN